jgi:transcriptional regulator with XRE-family HTH domain
VCDTHLVRKYCPVAAKPHCVLPCKCEKHCVKTNKMVGALMKGHDFKRWRRTLDLSQKEAAEILGLKRRVVQYYEKGERDGDPVKIPRTVRLACYAITIGVDDYHGPEKDKKPDKDKKKDKDRESADARPDDDGKKRDKKKKKKKAKDE